MSGVFFNFQTLVIKNNVVVQIFWLHYYWKA